MLWKPYGMPGTKLELALFKENALNAPGFTLLIFGVGGVKRLAVSTHRSLVLLLIPAWLCSKDHMLYCGNESSTIAQLLELCSVQMHSTGDQTQVF